MKRSTGLAIATSLLFVAPVLASGKTNLKRGEQIYQRVCSAGHATGGAGAPKFGDRAAWKDRIAKGLATLQQHAINGFHGDKGTMPPRGGDSSLSDADVKDAVAYMVKKSH